MSNEKNHDDEYQYPSEEEYIQTSEYTSPDDEEAETPASESESPTPKAKTKKDVITDKLALVLAFAKKNKRIVIIVAVVIVVFIIFSVMRHGNQKAMQPVQKTKTVQATPVAQPKPQQTIQAPSLSFNNSGDNDMQDQIKNLQNSEAGNQAAINQLQAQIQNLRTQLKQANYTNQQLTEGLALLAAEVKQLNNDLMTRTKPLSTQQQLAAMKPRKLEFFIKAVIPGRAWISTVEGFTDSVTVGDPVPDYGIVRMIDADHGRILTSSGKVIRYGSNDH